MAFYQILLNAKIDFRDTWVAAREKFKFVARRRCNPVSLGHSFAGGNCYMVAGSKCRNFGFQEKSAGDIALKQRQYRSAASLRRSIVISSFYRELAIFRGDELTPGEELFLKRLVGSHPQCVAVGDVFPYSASNKSLGGQRWLAPFWRFAEQAKSGPIAGDIFIKIRNLWRFAISLDYRYGFAYNQGMANAIIDRMNAKSPITVNPQQPLKVILIGTSGGAQVALGATHDLKEWLNAEITVISVGGVFSGEKGFAEADRIFHLRGTGDSIEDIGGIVFPSRWYWFATSPFNQARLQAAMQKLSAAITSTTAMMDILGKIKRRTVKSM